MKENEKRIPVGSDYYEDAYDGGFPISTYFYDRYNCHPSMYSVDSKFNKVLVEDLKKHKLLEEVFTNIHMESDVLKVDHQRTVFGPTNYGKYLLDVTVDDGEEISVRILYNNIEEIDFIIQILRTHANPSKKNRIGLIVEDDFGLTLKKFDVSVGDEFNVVDNYGKEFVKVNDKIMSSLKVIDGKGLVLLHGKPGTGKTTYIRYLITTLKKNIILVPPMMTTAITNPKFIPFLMKYPDSVLVIEDAETVIQDRKSGTPSEGVSNLLNLTDGILGECLKIQIVATFNTTKENIDSALLRKGRLITEYRFDELSVKDSKKLLKKLGHKNVKVDKPLTLADIYNWEEEQIRPSDNKRKIGFL